MLLQMVLFILFYAWVVFLCVMYILFIHSSANGFLDCFYVLTIVNSAAMSIGFMYLFKL